MIVGVCEDSYTYDSSRNNNDNNNNSEICRCSTSANGRYKNAENELISDYYGINHHHHHHYNNNDSVINDKRSRRLLIELGESENTQRLCDKLK